MGALQANNTSERETPPNFEAALGELQQIVDELEDGAIGLEESMRRFETGIRLLRTCYQILEQAEQKIEILTTRDADGNLVLEPFDASATVDSSTTTAGRRKRSAAKSMPKAEQPADSGQQADRESAKGDPKPGTSRKALDQDEEEETDPRKRLF